MWWTGEVRVSFTLQPDGHVRDIRVVRSSGRDVLDRCAVETVIDAAPYPRPPIDQEVEVPFEFRLVPL
jgi:protein TonB